jgi:hypothetical protein
VLNSSVRVSKKVVYLVILLLAAAGTICGALTPYLLSISSSAQPPGPQTEKPADNNPDPTPPPTFIPDVDVPEGNKIYATYFGDGMWEFDLPFEIWHYMIITPDITIIPLPSGRYYIPDSDETFIGRQIYLVFSSDTYILYLVNGGSS